MRIGSLFSGIGGLELGLEWAGLGETVWQVEQSAYCRNVLAKHWPSAERFEDVKEVGATNLAPVDIICGGFPCQDVSSAGKGAGLAGERSGLWREFARIIKEVAPAWAVVENVASGATRWVDAVVRDLGGLGYDALPLPISAQDVGAPHLRKRVFVIANARTSSDSNGERVWFESRRCEREDWEDPAEPGWYGADGSAAQAARHGGWEEWPTISPVCGVDDGVPARVDRLRALGNAVVPQCAEVVGWVIRELMASPYWLTRTSSAQSHCSHSTSAAPSSSSTPAWRRSMTHPQTGQPTCMLPQMERHCPGSMRA